MDIIKVFGTNVRKYRTQKKVSQEKFADICGLHRTYISDIECFRRSISLDNIQKIADALDIDTYKLFLEENWDIKALFQLLQNKYKGFLKSAQGKTFQIYGFDNSFF